jgi:hypothetical protein
MFTKSIKFIKLFIIVGQSILCFGQYNNDTKEAQRVIGEGNRIFKTEGMLELKRTILGVQKAAIKENDKFMVMAGITLDIFGNAIYEGSKEVMGIPDDPFYSPEKMAERFNLMFDKLKYNKEDARLQILFCKDEVNKRLQQMSTKTSGVSAPSKNESPVTVEGLRVAINEYGNPRVVGMIRNQGPRKISYIFVTWDLLDRDGTVLEQANESLSNGLDAGSSFKIDHAIAPRYRNAKVKLKNIRIQ